MEILTNKEMRERAEARIAATIRDTEVAEFQAALTAGEAWAVNAERLHTGLQNSTAAMPVARITLDRWDLMYDAQQMNRLNTHFARLGYSVTNLEDHRHTGITIKVN